MKHILISVLVLSLSACGAIHRGSVAMKISDTEAHVCLGSREVKAGDSIAAFRNECSRTVTSPKKGFATQPCEKQFLGNGKITEILNEHYSVARFPANIGFKEGDVVERVGG